MVMTNIGKQYIAQKLGEGLGIDPSTIQVSGQPPEFQLPLFEVEQPDQYVQQKMTNHCWSLDGLKQDTGILDPLWDALHTTKDPLRSIYLGRSHYADEDSYSLRVIAHIPQSRPAISVQRQVERWLTEQGIAFRLAEAS